MPRFDAQGLVPVVVQDVDTGLVLMLAYASREALERTRETGRAHFYSRSRQALWDKGATSGQVLEVLGIREDCDEDALLYLVRARRGACHTGAESCFGQDLTTVEELGRLWRTIASRLASGDPQSSYTRRLYDAGIDRILRKVGEEAGEVIIAAKNKDASEAAAEAADLVYHLFLALQATGVPLSDLSDVLARRRGAPPSLRADAQY